MPFSSVLGASSVIKPGVCTSTTRPSVPYEGQLIYETDTDRVAAYNGSAWVYIQIEGKPGLITSGNFTAATTITFSGLAGYDNIKILIDQMKFSAENYVRIRINSDSTSKYRYASSANTNPNTGVVAAIRNGDNRWISSPSTSMSMSPFNHHAGTVYDQNYHELTFSNARGNNFTYFDSWSYHWGAVAGYTSQIVQSRASGIYENAVQLTSVSLISGGGSNFDTSTTYRIYGW